MEGGPEATLLEADIPSKGGPSQASGRENLPVTPTNISSITEDDLKRARILIVDDDVGIVSLLENVFDRTGFANHTSLTDSREAIRRIFESQPDVILLDLNMPNVTGFDVLQQLRAKLPPDAFLPVLVITGETEPRTKRKALAAGATDFLQKPFDMTELLTRIRNLLRARLLHLELEKQNEVLEQKVSERTAELSSALAELKKTQKQVVQQERLRAFGEMAGGVVHDFNNSLISIIGFSDLLLNNPDVLDDHKTTLHHLKLMNTAGRDAAHVVKRLRDFYRNRESEDVFAAVDLNEIIEQSVSLTQPKWKTQALNSGRNIEIKLNLEKVPPVSGNPAELREAVTNLIFNAVDAMPVGGTVTLRSHVENGTVLLEISDTGTGMSEEVRAHCLEPFFSTKGEKGTGLGLSMVFGIIKRHSGTLDVESAVARGSTFRIRFPADPNGMAAREVATEAVKAAS
jgi:signal transduction histidine kinase